MTDVVQRPPASGPPPPGRDSRRRQSATDGTPSASQRSPGRPPEAGSRAPETRQYPERQAGRPQPKHRTDPQLKRVKDRPAKPGKPAKPAKPPKPPKGRDARKAAQLREAELQAGEARAADRRARERPPGQRDGRAAQGRRAGRPAAKRTQAQRPKAQRATSQRATSQPATAQRAEAARTRAQRPPQPAPAGLPVAGKPNLILPVPPSREEKYSYIKKHGWILTVCSVASFPPLVYSQARMVATSHWFWLYAPFAALGVGCFLLSVLVDGVSRSFDLTEHQKIVNGWNPSHYPSVDVFLPVCGEPIEVLHNTWHHVAAMRRHYPGRVTAWVLDDSASPDLKDLARKFGFAYATRPDRGWLKKSGNLLYGFQISDGEFVLLLDADFAPRYDLLNETVPYMDMFPEVGIVQTPQFFHVLDQQSWVERGAGAIQELFYRAIQTARARKKGAICVGSCAVYRRAALEYNGGMSLAEHSEDLHTGFDLFRQGWRLRYLPIALSTGMCPDNVLAFLNQQYRWCSGTMSLLRHRKFWRNKLGLYTRMCYLSGFVGYIYTAIFTFIAPALAIAMLVFVPAELTLSSLAFIAPVLFYAGVVYPLWHRAPYRLEAWSVRVISGWAHIFAFWDVLRGRQRGWKPSGTGKGGQDGRRRFWIGLIAWSGGTAVLWAGLGFWRMMTMNPYNLFLIFVLGVFQVVVVGRILIQPSVGSAA